MRRVRHAPRRHSADGLDDGPRVIGRRAATTADEVDEPLLRELAQVATRVGGLLVMGAELIRQARVRIARRPRGCDLGQVLYERTHLRAAQRAVHSDDERVRVLDRDPERLGGLAGEVAAAQVDGGERQPERDLRRDLLRRDDRGLRIERVEHGLDQQQVGAALDETGDLLRVRVTDLVERRGAIRRIVDLRRERERNVERTERAGDEAVAAELVHGAAGEARSRDAHLVREPLEPIVGLADRGRREGVCRRDVGTGLEVGAVDP